MAWKLWFSKFFIPICQCHTNVSDTYDHWGCNYLSSLGLYFLLPHLESVFRLTWAAQKQQWQQHVLSRAERREALQKCHYFKFYKRLIFYLKKTVGRDIGSLCFGYRIFSFISGSSWLKKAELVGKESCKTVMSSLLEIKVFVVKKVKDISDMKL